MRDMESNTVGETLVEGFISRMGVPMIIYSDQGKNFKLKLFKQMTNLVGIKKTRTTAFRSCSNGLVERCTRTLNEMLCTPVGEHSQAWDQVLPLLTMAYRGTPHESTGFNPYFKVYGRELYMPIDIMMRRLECSEDVDELDYVQELRERLEDAYEAAREHLKLSAIKQKSYYDVRSNEQPYK